MESASFDPSAPSYIVFCRFPDRFPTAADATTLLWVPIALGLGAIAFSTYPLWMPASFALQAPPAFVGGCLGGYFIMFLFVLFIRWSIIDRSIRTFEDRLRRGLDCGYLDKNVHEALRWIGLYRISTYRRRRKDWGTALRAEFQNLLDMCPRTLADQIHADELKKITLDDLLYEPERVRSNPSQKYLAFNLIGLCLFFILTFLFLAVRSYIPAALFGTLAIMQFFTLAPVYRRIRHVLPKSHRLPIVGPGAVVDQHNRRWTINDSIMLVRGGSGNRRMYVHLFGPEGILELSFLGPQDEDFQFLWQQWNHPHPRPELLV